jgi:O-antigen ligase
MGRGWTLAGNRSAAATVAACALVAGLTVLAALRPGIAALSAPVLVAVAVAVSHLAVTARISAGVAMTVLVIALAGLVAIAPVAGVVLAVALLAVACVWAVRGAPGSLQRALERLLAAVRISALVLAALFGLSITAFGVAVAPAATLLAAVVVGIAVVATRYPALALGAAVLLFGFEGSVKILLGLDGIQLPGGNRAAGAAALDVALLAGLAGVFARDRFRAPRALWASATRAERAVICVIGAWLALSVLQIAQGGDIGRGLHGFRLFQWYTVLALAALTIFAEPRIRPAALRAVLWIGLVVSLYAAVRIVIGPADSELSFATAVKTVTVYGDTVRAVGSFSSAIGLSSFLTPLSVFTLVLGLLVPRLRILSWTIAALALVGLIGSYSRTSLFGVALGLACALLLVFVASDLSTRRKLVSVGIVVAMLGATYGGLLVASRSSPELRERAEGVRDPLADKSVKLRLEAWENVLERVPDHPFGLGVGRVGAASADDSGVRTTDNSFLKVLVDQGVLGLLLFAGGMLGAVAVLARRLRTSTPPALRPVGLAALAGFVAFLGISFAGETVEQPGKVLAWSLLGIATAYAFGDALSESEQA